MYRNKKSGIIGIIITIIILILLVILTNTENSNLSYVENIANKLVNPIQNGLTYVKNKIHGNSSFFTNINDLKSQNEELIAKNNDYTTVVEDVISRDISNYSKTIIINAGKNSGIHENMTVIASEGLVGYVISATDTTSKVQTIIDSSSNTSSLLSSSRDSVVCKGMLKENKTLKSVYIPTEANIAQDDTVETSGLGGIYPKGIYIGKISKVINTTNLEDRYALVETAVDFNKLETVLVITN